AVPVPDPVLERGRKRVLLSGDPPSPFDPPSGCRFHPRCRYARAECRTGDPGLLSVGDGRWAACPVLPFQASPSEAALCPR
ncbi:MAG: oligopeptide/dipeptide ABC transporter ATP-binding protein, partial [Elusimicrobiota bacterium]